jgi:hypothetical protein
MAREVCQPGIAERSARHVEETERFELCDLGQRVVVDARAAQTQMFEVWQPGQMF